MPNKYVRKFIKIGRIASKECDNNHSDKISCLGDESVGVSLTPGNFNGGRYVGLLDRCLARNK